MNNRPIQSISKFIFIMMIIVGMQAGYSEDSWANSAWDECHRIATGDGAIAFDRSGQLIVYNEKLINCPLCLYYNGIPGSYFKAWAKIGGNWSYQGILPAGLLKDVMWYNKLEYNKFYIEMMKEGLSKLFFQYGMIGMYGTEQILKRNSYRILFY